MTHRLQIILLLIAMTFGLGACGVRGGLVTPPEDRATKASDAEPGEDKTHKPFILDRLIR